MNFFSYLCYLIFVFLIFKVINFVYDKIISYFKKNKKGGNL